jgi:hypothetical protein
VFGTVRQGCFLLKRKSSLFFSKKSRPSKILQGRPCIIYNLVGRKVTVVPSSVGQVIKTLIYVFIVSPLLIPLRVSFPFSGSVCIIALGKVVSNSELSTSLMGDPVSGQASTSDPSSVITCTLAGVSPTEYSTSFRSTPIPCVILLGG